MGLRNGVVGALFHALACLYHAYVAHFVFTGLRAPHTPGAAKSVRLLGRFQERYFTSWNFAIQTAYFICCFLEDLLWFAPRNSLIENFKISARRTRDFVFRTFVFPLTFTVASIFWMIFTYDRELIFPAALDTIFPLWLNHALHSNITVFVILEMFLVSHRYPSSMKHSIRGLILYFLVYGICFFGTYLVHGAWLYPIFGLLSWRDRIVGSVLVFAIAVVFCISGQKLNTVFWNDKNQHQSSAKRAKLKVK